jgi:hypothetical protein
MTHVAGERRIRAEAVGHLRLDGLRLDEVERITI